MFLCPFFAAFCSFRRGTPFEQRTNLRTFPFEMQHTCHEHDHHHYHHHCERGALFKCSYPGCGATFSSRLAEKMHRAEAHPPRQSIHDAELLQKYIRRFQLTGSGGKPFGQGPLASYRTSWCGGMVNMAALQNKPSARSISFACPHPECQHTAGSSDELLQHHHEEHGDGGLGPSSAVAAEVC